MFARAGEPDRFDVARGRGEAVTSPGGRQDRIEIRIPSDTDLLPAMRRFLRSLFVHGDWANPGPRVLSELQLVLQEACVNAIRHACRRRSDESIRVTFVMLGNGITIEVCDDGPGFDPADVPAPDARDMKEGGYGVFIIGEFMDQVKAFRRGRQFVMSMTRYFDAETGTGESEES